MQIKNGSLVTKKLLRAWGACWDDARIDEFLRSVGKRVRGLPLETVLRDSRIALPDRLWVGTRYLESVDPQAGRLFAIECAMSVAKYAGDEDAIENHLAMCSWQYEIELCYAEEDKSAAWSAAWSAAQSVAYNAADSAAQSVAYSAANSAAYNAAYSAAYKAADSVAYSAARSVARSAAYNAAYNAAWSAAVEGYIDNLLAWLTAYPENL